MKKKLLIICATVTALASFLMISASADTGTINVTQLMTSSFQTMVNDLIAIVAGILPIGLSVLGISIGVAFAVKWIKRITGKA
jgi:uncharacterized secreted protein with C-terminal beta-propeller domain